MIRDAEPQAEIQARDRRTLFRVSGFEAFSWEVRKLLSESAYVRLHEGGSMQNLEALWSLIFTAGRIKVNAGVALESGKAG